METRSLVNPRSERVRVVLSDGSQRIVAGWGMAIVPRLADGGEPLEVVSAEILGISSSAPPAAVR